MEKIYMIPEDMQLFADGGDGADAGGGSGESGAEQSVTAGVAQRRSQSVAKEQQESSDASGQSDAAKQETTKSQEERFEELISGEFKQQYHDRMSKALDKRFKSAKANEEKLSEYSAIAQMLGERYGVDATDTAAIKAALNSDDAWLQDKALERGVPVEVMREINAKEREIADLRKQKAQADRQREFDQKYAEWESQSAEVKGVYPSFNLRKELENDVFRDMVFRGFPVMNAYQMAHFSEIVSQAQQTAASEAEKKVTERIRSNGARPTEIGIGSSSPGSSQRVDVSKMSLKELRAFMEKKASESR